MLSKIDSFLKSVNFPYRGSCPICFHKNTFSALLLDGNVVIYRCFSASCKVKGRLNDNTLSIDTIRNEHNINRMVHNNVQHKNYVIPDHFTSPLQNPKCLAFIKRWDLLEEYCKGLELYYDPRQERLVFPLRDQQGGLKGAVGRLLYFSNSPRWFVYSRQDGCPYSLFRSTFLDAILVEDAISAIRASNIACGVAILGTNIPINMYKFLQSFNKLFIALDDDATGSAIRLQKDLSLIKPTFILPLKKDLKYYNTFELQELKKCLE